MSLDRILFIIIGVWLILLSSGFYWLGKRILKFTHGTKTDNIIKVLDSVLSSETANKNDIKNLHKEIKNLEYESTFHIQKVGLIRFNPFKDLGGDHSFAIALLDKEDTGIIFTGLHTRERTRIYVKSVKKGKAEYQLSSEEKKALEKAKK